MKTITPFKEFTRTTSAGWFVAGLVLLRVLLGVQFLFAGLDKFGGWSAKGYLLASTGPFASFFQSLAGNLLVDQLNIWGLVLIGIALILGFFVRPASMGGALLMLLYYFAQFEQNTTHGLIEWHLVYAVVFVLFLSGGVGHVFGLDGLVSRNLRKKKGLLRWLIG